MRYEIKFPFNFNDLNKLNSWIDGIKKIKKIHSKRYINNVYFDDINFSSAQENLDGFSNKKKNRLRWYTSLDNELSNCTFEIKIKQNRLNYKDLYKSDKKIDKIKYIHLFDKYLNPFVNLSKDQKLNLFKLNNKLFPVIQNKYKREYLIYKNKVRLTIDNEMEYINVRDNKKLNYLSKFYVLEIKFKEEDKKLAFEILKSVPFVNSKFSKYIHGLRVMNKVSFF
jgi:hypothetical protein